MWRQKSVQNPTISQSSLGEITGTGGLSVLELEENETLELTLGLIINPYRVGLLRSIFWQHPDLRVIQGWRFGDGRDRPF